MMIAARKARLTFPSGTFIPLLVALLVVLVIAPLVEDWPAGIAILVALVLLTGVFAVHDNPLLRKGMVAAVIVVLGLHGLAHARGDEYPSLVIVSHLAVGMYMFVLGSICLGAILRREHITIDTVLGAVCGYLLIAYFFVFAYAVLVDANPGSFRGSVKWPADDGAKIGYSTPELMYYSFVTLTTVGYGDIVPASKAARSLTILEMLAGQLYLAAFVARLVSVMTVRTKRGDAS